MLTYGGGSIKKNGIYDEVIKALKDAGKEVFEDPGVMSNPTVQKLYEGCRIAKENDVDLILAVGGGSTIDYAKAVSVYAWCGEDPTCIAVKNPEDYEARSNLMWSATWALNTLIAKGKSTDWEVHMIGQAIGAYTDATHGMTLSAVSLPYYRHIMPYGLHRFVRFAKEVWDIRTEDMSEQDAAEAGLAAMESWMKEIGVVLSAKELGVTEDMIDGIADATFLFDGRYKALTRDEVVEIIKESL